MAQRRNQARFILEALVDLCAGSQSTVENLDRIQASRANVASDIYGSNATGPEEALNAIGLGQDFADDVLVSGGHGS